MGMPGLISVLLMLCNCHGCCLLLLLLLLAGLKLGPRQHARQAREALASSRCRMRHDVLRSR